jgi:hypothetical protein
MTESSISEANQGLMTQGIGHWKSNELARSKNSTTDYALHIRPNLVSIFYAFVISIPCLHALEARGLPVNSHHEAPQLPIATRIHKEMLMEVHICCHRGFAL